MEIADLSISTDITLEGYDLQDIKDFPGDWENDDNCFATIVDEVVIKHFKNSCNALLPLLKDIKIVDITIAVDIIGMSAGEAGYYPGYSNSEKGLFFFYISPDILAEYLHQHWNPEVQLSKFVQFLWEHEIIHMLDQKNLAEFNYRKEGASIEEFLLNYFLSFRNEGIADLYSFVNNYRKIEGIDEAHRRFEEEMEKLGKLPWEDFDRIRENEKQFIKSSAYYAIGPWMLLHTLCCEENPNYNRDIAELCQQVIRKENIGEENCIRLIQSALEIGNNTFLKCIRRKGLDAKVFMEGKLLDQALPCGFPVV